MRYITISVTLVALTMMVPARAQQAAKKPLFFDSQKMAASFAKGGRFLDQGNYQIYTLKHDAPTRPEVHATDAEIMYITGGSFTMEAGGTLVDAKPAGNNPNELRGTAIQGGELQALKKGDLFIVPAGVPHRYHQVEETAQLYMLHVRTEQ